MKNRLFRSILVLAMCLILFASLSSFTSAADVTASGTCGSTLTWTLDADGVLTVSGTGAMDSYRAHYTAYRAPWTTYSKNIKKVIIEEGVTKVGSDAFYNCVNLTEVTLPSTLVTIEGGSFQACTSLAEIQLPEGLTFLGSLAFQGAPLSDLTIPASVSTIGPSISYARIWVDEANPYFCSTDQGALLTKDMTTLYRIPGSFSGNYKIPESVTTIKRLAFANCDALTGVTIPESVTTIEERAFVDCGSLVNVSIPDSITVLEYSLFSSCEKLERVELPETLVEIRDYAFSNCESLKEIIIPNNVTALGGSVFNYCTALTSVTIGSKVETIGSYAFDNCTALEEVILPDALTTIGSYAFSQCEALKNITFPSSVAYIEDSAFGYCYGLTQIVFLGNAPTIGYDAFCGVTADVRYVAKDTTWTADVTQDYGGTLNWIAAEEVAASGTCGDNLSWTLDGFGTLIISGSGAMDEPKSSEDGSPWSGYYIKKVIIEPGATTIGSYAFEDCTDLEEITLPDTITVIDYMAFYNCQKLKVLEIPKNVTKIGSYAFSDCASVREFVIPYGITNVPYAAFSGCEKLERIVIPDTVTTISAWAFASCGFAEINIPSSVTTIGENAFAYCNNLIEVTVPDSVTTLERRAFESCDNLTSVTLPANLTVIPQELFYTCQSLAHIVIPESVTTIGSKAFYFCKKLSGFVIPKNVTSIGANAFSYATALTNIEFTGSAPTIASNAFSSVTATVRYPVNNTTWSSGVMQNYGGTLSWITCFSIQEGTAEAGLTLRMDGDYGLFDSVSVDGNTVDPVYYTVSEGSTIVTLSPAYLQTLSSGEHTVTVHYTDGTQQGATVLLDIIPAPVTVPTLRLDHPSLSFEGEIMYNLYFTVDDLTSVVEMGLLGFNTQLQDGTLESADHVYPGYSSSGEMYMCQTEGIPARYLGDAVYFKAYAKLTDGSYVYSNMVGFNAVVYAKSILKNSESDHMKCLVVAMMNYGAEAQSYFCAKDGVAFTPMNSFLTADQQALISAYDASMVADLIAVDSNKIGIFTYTTGDFARRYNSVSFDGAFSLNYYFTAKDTPDNGMKLYYWNTADYLAADVLTAENATGSMDMVPTGTENQFWGNVPNIAAKQVDETMFVAGVYELDGVTYTTGVLAYSLGKYCAKLATGTGEQQALSAATAVYGFYAKEYFANL